VIRIFIFRLNNIDMGYLEELSAKVRKEEEVFIAPNATVIGNVFLGRQSSVWFGAVLRGDTDEIHIGARSNIQDNSVLHVDPGVPIHIGEEVIIGHGAVIHGAAIGNNVLVGMRSVILNNAKIGNWCIIGANSLVTEGMEIPDYSIVMGSPAKVVKQVNEDWMKRIKRNAEAYVELAKNYIGAY
jgi:carbonic anhydrase/acetyltransferase-like protein (isoleucine patch superfamily)